MLDRSLFPGCPAMNSEHERVDRILSRRQVLGGASAACVLAAGPVTHAAQQKKAEPTGASSTFLFGLNTATIRGQKLPVVDEIALAAKVGYEGMEPWIDELQRYAEAGGSLQDLGKRFRDAGIRVESAIDFFEGPFDDEPRRKNGLEAARKSMEMLQKIGGK